MLVCPVCSHTYHAQCHHSYPAPPPSRTYTPEQVVIPSFEATIAYVTSELDEIEKEEFFRLKKVLKVKLRNAEIEEEEEKKQLALMNGGGEGGGGVGGAGAFPSETPAELTAGGLD
jgi:hypothetical protein